MATYTVRDVADQYGVREKTVRAWIARDELEAVNVGVAPDKQKPRWRITEQALKDFEQRRTSGGRR